MNLHVLRRPKTSPFLAKALVLTQLMPAQKLVHGLQATAGKHSPKRKPAKMDCWVMFALPGLGFRV